MLGLKAIGRDLKKINNFEHATYSVILSCHPLDVHT